MPTDIHPFDLFVLLRDNPQIKGINVVGYEIRRRGLGVHSYDVECGILDIGGKLYVEDMAAPTKLTLEDLK